MYTRNSARAVIIDSQQRILLFQFSFGELVLWVTPGGGLEPNESFEDGLKRELYEETGAQFDTVGPCVFIRNLLIEREIKPFNSHERYYYLPVDQLEVSIEQLTDNEKDTLHTYKWWPIADILAPNDGFAPPNIGQLALALLNGEVPKEPVEID